MDFCQCGSIKYNGTCSNQRCPELNQKRKDWIIDGIQKHFKKAILYEEAVNIIEKTKS